MFERSDMTYEFNGCQIQMELYYRSDRDQYYYKCSGNSHVSSIPGLDEGHRYKKLTTITKSSFWYKRKAAAHKILGAMMDYMRKESLQQIFDSRSLSKGALLQIIRDIQVMMLSDYKKHALTPENRLGVNPRCHHIQIDESKIGKRKNNVGSRVEGVWVFRMVEALIPESGPMTYQYIDNRNNIDETRHRYVAGRRFFCTVPNRVAATLLPIIYKYCARGSVIRSDGWRAYRGLHNQETQDQFEANGLTFGGVGTGLYFRAHQVVNHSQGFATRDQVSENPVVSHVPESGLIHTNIIESLWRDMKVFIKPRHRTVRSAPGKLLEYLWFIDNKEDVMGGMARFLREVKFSDNTGIIETGDNNQGSFEPDMFTEARSGETPEQQERREDRDQSNFEAWVNRRRARDEEELVGIEVN